MYLMENEVRKKWEKAGVLNHEDLPEIKDSYKRDVTLRLLENQAADMKLDIEALTEAAPTNHMGASSSTAGTGAIDTWDPILISLVRRTTPQLIAFDVVGVQPMTGPTGLIFAMKSTYVNQEGNEAGGQVEYDTDFSGNATPVHAPEAAANAGGDATATDNPFAGTYTTGVGMSTETAEKLGDGSTNFGEMAFTIDKTSVTAKSRALKAEYTTELAQDLKAVHGLDAESELANILSQEIVGETNREVIRTIYTAAVQGANAGHVATPGVFDVDVDANGRWSVEKFKGLMFQMMRDANQIAKDTRRGKGNLMICSSDVASALSMAGMLETGHGLSVDDTGSTFAGTMGGIKVYIDPYWTITNFEMYVMGYKGSSSFDAGIFYTPYVPLQMVRAVGENTFQPKIGFKTRYGIVNNPFTVGLGAGQNNYYRKVRVTNVM